MKKNNIQVIEGKESIDKFFKKLGVEELCNGIDVTAKKSLKVPKRFKTGKKKLYKAKKDDRYIEGYGSTPDIDWVQDSVTLEALKDAEQHLLRQGTNTVFYNHDTDKPIGKVVGAFADEKGLFNQILISKAKDVDDIWTKIKEGILSSFSVRFIAKRIEIEKDEDNNVVSYDITKMELLEVSVVGLPMNKEASITSVRGKSIKSLFKKGIKNMKKAKKETITEVVKELLDTMLSDKIEKSVEGIEDRIVEKMEVNAEEADKKAKKAEKKAKKLEAKAKAKDDEDDADEDEESEEMKTLKKEKADLEKELEESKKESKSKKKSVEDDEDDDGDEPKKALKDIEDEDTCIFVLKCMDDVELFNTLSDSEKKKASALYMAMAKSEGKL